MPLGEGWWLDLRTGRAFPVDEHAHSVCSRPRQYRLRPEDVEGLVPGTRKDRDVLRRLAVRKGFARVRYHKGIVTVEYDAPAPRRALARIGEFLSDTFGPGTTVHLNDLRRQWKFHWATGGGCELLGEAPFSVSTEDRSSR